MSNAAQHRLWDIKRHERLPIRKRLPALEANRGNPQENAIVLHFKVLPGHSNDLGSVFERDVGVGNLPRRGIDNELCDVSEVVTRACFDGPTS
jgi:hypothetical protein